MHGSGQDNGGATGEPWQPLSVRYGGGKPIDQTWQEGVPTWVGSAVRKWLSLVLTNRRVHERLYARLHYNDQADLAISEQVNYLSEEALLDWVDAALHISNDLANKPTGSGSHYRVCDDLDAILREGRSIWKVSELSDSLERRQDTTVTAAASHAVKSAVVSGRATAGEHLEGAWSETYGLHPDPSKAFSEAIKAVEAAAVPVIVPNHTLATLGDVYGQLKRQGNLYELALMTKDGDPAPITPVTEMIGLLWHGHTDRHEGNVQGIPITQESAEMAVHAAATLVQWFTTGAIRRKPRRSNRATT